MGYTSVTIYTHSGVVCLPLKTILFILAVGSRAKAYNYIFIGHSVANEALGSCSLVDCGMLELFC